MALTIRPGRPSEWKEILAVSHTAFNQGPTFFPKGWPHTYPDKSAAEWFVVCEDEGKLIGIINQTPTAVRVSGVSLKAVGIGGVGVLPDARKRGAMSGMLTASNEWQRNAGTLVGFLGGDRIRYRRYGYELAGERITATLTQKQLKDVKPIRLRRLRAGDAAAVLRLYRKSPLLIDRDLIWQERLLRRSGFEAFGNASGPLRAYLVMRKDAPQNICELVGDAKTVPALLKGHLNRHKRYDAQCAWIPGYEPQADLGRSAAWVGSAVAQQVSIFDFEQFIRRMAGPLAARFREFGITGTLRVEHKGEGKTLDLAARRAGALSVEAARGRTKPDLSLDAAAWVRLFFPPPGGPLLPCRVDPRLAAALGFRFNFSGWDSL